MKYFNKKIEEENDANKEPKRYGRYATRQRRWAVVKSNPVFQDYLLKLTKCYMEERSFPKAIHRFRKENAEFESSKRAWYLEALKNQLVLDLGIKKDYDLLTEQHMEGLEEAFFIAIEKMRETGNPSDLINVIKSREEVIGKAKRGGILIDQSVNKGAISNTQNNTENNFMFDFGIREADIVAALPPELKDKFPSMLDYFMNKQPKQIEQKKVQAPMPKLDKRTQEILDMSKLEDDD